MDDAKTIDHEEDLRFDSEMHCKWCGESLQKPKGGPNQNGLHAECGEELNKEMDEAWGPMNHVRG